MELAIDAERLVKTYGDKRAVDGLDLRVRAGTIYGLLGPNGAGKTTTVRMLSTLASIDGGRATVLGHDVASAPDAVRRRISRLNRAGVELVPEPSTTLQFGDILNLVGRPDSIDLVAGMMGNAHQKLQQVHMLPVFIGIGLGVLLGSIPFYLPGIPAALKLGLAGGPLVVALIVSRPTSRRASCSSETRS